MTVVAVDAMGGDFAPEATVGGAILAASGGIDVALVGNSEVVGQELNRRGTIPPRLRLVHAPDVVGMGEKAAQEVRRRRQTSLYVGAELVKRGEAQALVSMGHTGAAMATALVVLGRLKGLERPALGAVVPAGKGDEKVLLLDVGANADARASHLVQFGHMGAAYLRSVYEVPEPRVALLSIGEEPTKGSSLVLDAHRALAVDESVRFTGNIESREILSGQADVIVTDGFTGNICLKLAEGLLDLLFNEMRETANSSWRMRVGGALLLPGLRGVRDRLDYRRYGAVPMLGVNGAVFIGHGRSDAETVASAILTARDAVERQMVEALADSVAG